MSEIDPVQKGADALEIVRLRLLEASQQCSGLASLLSSNGEEGHKDALTLREGANIFLAGAADLERIQELMELIDASFSEEGPRLPVLLRELPRLATAHTPSSKPFEPPMIGVFKCTRGGKLVEDFRKHAAKWIRKGIPTPYDPEPDDPKPHSWKRPKMTSFSSYQQIITKAFFQQEDGVLIHPTLLDVFGHYLQEKPRRYSGKLLWFYEENVPWYQQEFEKQASEVLYKLRYRGRYTANEYKTVRGLRKFEKVIGSVIEEYEEISGQAVTSETLERVALREITDIFSLKAQFQEV